MPQTDTKDKTLANLSRYARHILEDLAGVYDLLELEDGYFLRLTLWRVRSYKYKYKKVRSATVRMLLRKELIRYDETENDENPHLKLRISKYDLD